MRPGNTRVSSRDPGGRPELGRDFAFPYLEEPRILLIRLDTSPRRCATHPVENRLMSLFDSASRVGRGAGVLLALAAATGCSA